MTMDTMLVQDEYTNPVLIFQNDWSIRQIEERNKNVKLEEISLRK